MDNTTKKIKVYLADSEQEELEKLKNYFDAKNEEFEVVGMGSDGMVIAGEVVSLKCLRVKWAQDFQKSSLFQIFHMLDLFQRL